MMLTTQTRTSINTTNTYDGDEGENTTNGLIYLWLQKKKPATREQYTGDIKLFMVFAGEHSPSLDFKCIPLSVFVEYEIYLKETYKTATVRRKLSSLASFCHFALKLGYMTTLPSAVFEHPPKPHTLSGKRLTTQQVYRLIDRTEDHRNRCLLLTLYALGLRVSECINLKWCDLHTVGNKTTVNILGKGDKQRTLILPPNVLTELERLRLTQQHSSDNAYIFQSYSNGHRVQSGRQLDRIQAYKLVKQLAIDVGLPDGTSPHWLRHAHAIHSLAAGAKIDLVKTSLGHTNIATTNYYLEVDPNDCTSLYLSI